MDGNNAPRHCSPHARPDREPRLLAPSLIRHNTHLFQVRDQIASRVLEDAEERVAVVHIIAEAGLSAASILELGETLRNMPFDDDRCLPSSGTLFGHTPVVFETKRRFFDEVSVLCSCAHECNCSKDPSGNPRKHH